MKTADRLKILSKVQDLLGGAELEAIPEMLKRVLQVVGTPPCIVSFAFDPAGGRIRQIAISDIPRTAAAFAAISQVTLQVAQNFQQLSVGVTNNVASNEEGMERTSEDMERGDRDSPDETDSPGDGVGSLP